MKKEQTIIAIREKFICKVQEGLYVQCPEATTEDLLRYLSERRVIKFVEMKRYVVAKAFEEYQRNGYTITKAVRELAAEYGLAESELWTIRKEHQNRFE